MQILYSLIPAIILFLQGVGFKVYALKGRHPRVPEVAMNNFNFLLCVLIVAPFAFVGSAFDPISIAYGVFHGIAFCFMVMFYNKAASVGKLAFSNFVMALAMLFPIVFFALVGVESLGMYQYIGLAVAVGACFLVSFGQKDSAQQKTPKAAYVYALIAMVCGGTVSILSKQFAIVYPEINSMQYLCSACFVAFVIATVWNGFTTKFQNMRAYFSDKWFIICLAAIALSTAFGNIAFVHFVNMVDSAVFFPISNGLPMVLAAAASPLFKEKISAMTVIGIIVAIVAAILLNI